MCNLRTTHLSALKWVKVKAEEIATTLTLPCSIENVEVFGTYGWNLRDMEFVWNFDSESDITKEITITTM